ncbi:MAG: cupin domain-containing protein [Sneathiella sp.]|uniref:cupin domain-containing protein n=1 Tax=Sneathiella sp. TaxID=1964365 RepID=UPI00300146A1
MTRTFKTFRDIAIATSVAALLVGAAPAHAGENSVKLLSADFASRQVVQVEVGDFHFKPGQVAPIHTHTAPAVGYVAKGEIIYQVEGEKPQILREGDAFFEPTDKRILRFDNASATEEAIFIDFNLQQQGEPFIVFEKKPTEAIDRRSLPTVKIANEMFDRVDVYTNDVAKSGSLLLDTFEPVMGVVAEGIVELRVKGQPTQRIVAGKSFAVPVAGTEAQIVNVSDEIPAKIVTFHLS